MGSRTIVIGDIHGCYDELEDMLTAVGFAAEDRVISVGDLITKGPKNREVLERFMSDPQFSAVMGNHDLALRRKWNGEKVKLKDSQKPTNKELKKDKERYLSFLNSLPFMIDLGTHLVVHAGLRPGVALQSQTSEDLTELRSMGKDRAARDGTPWYDVYDGEKVVLFGHWPAAEPRRGKRAIGLDTGCVYGNELTAYIIETGEFKTVPARRRYDPS
jgi:diadenosine tetraphosphatase ApaH/serine/threonine PP2A family protein phosphatase